MRPPPRQCIPAGKLDADMFARPEKVMVRRLVGLRPLPAPVKNFVPPLTIACEQGSATHEPVRTGSTAPPGPIDLSHTHAGRDSRAGAVERFRSMTERDTGNTGLEQDKRELLSLFESRRDTGYILDVTEGDIASPTGVALTRMRWPVPRADTTQSHPATPVPVSTHRRLTKDRGCSNLKKLETLRVFVDACVLTNIEKNQIRSAFALREWAGRGVHPGR